MTSSPDPLPLQTAALDAAAQDGAGERMMALMRALYPLPRSITGPGVRATLAEVARRIPLQLTELPSGTQVFDWTVPPEWRIDEAYLEHESGRRFAEFSASNLHVVAYSVPVDRVMTLDELRPHLHSLPRHPDWIPFRNTYYKPDWGFCLADRELQSLPAGNYRVVIRSTLAPGSLTWAEFVHPGESADEVLLFAHTCHPSLCNDNLSGIVVATEVAAHLARCRTRLSYRVLFAPATIGSIAWMATRESGLPAVKHGLVLAMLGDAGRLNYQRTKSGQAAIDRAAAAVLGHHHPDAGLLDFSPWGFDERQFNTPGIGLPVGRLTRAVSGGYPEEHTSADNLDLISPHALSEAWLAVLRIVESLESDRRWINTSPKGEPQMGRRGLYRQSGGYYDHVPERHMAFLWLLQFSDGAHSLLDIAQRSGLDPALLAACAADLHKAGLLVPA
jgi:aminopeptidase-like protein